MTKKESILNLVGISKRFPGVQALDKVDLEIFKGEIHAIVGENGAGKTTLMKVINGIYKPDEGDTFWKGEKVAFTSPHQTLASGISMIFQEIELVQSTTIAENIWIGREKNFSRFGILDKKLQIEKTNEIFKTINIDLNPKTIVRNLSVAEMQMVELARAISFNADMIIMDEPTSALSESEIGILFSVIRGLASEGVTILFISHKLDEVIEISDRVTAMRDGKKIATAETSQIDQKKLIQWIVGRELKDMYPKETAEITDTALEIKNLNALRRFKDINFHVRRGEILGFCGLVGSGRTELMRAIFGIDEFDSGEIIIDGKKVDISSPKKAIDYGLGMVTEDRLRLGIFKQLSVRINLSLVYLDAITSKLGFVNNKKENIDSRKIVDKLSIKCNLKQVISGLSGGNQQKCIIGRWLLANPKILILDEPTRGIDVGSKSEIHHQIGLLAQQGIAIIFISSELPEILGISDRIMVMRNGRIVGEYERENANQKQLMEDAFG